jgi:hypothetical protein
MSHRRRDDAEPLFTAGFVSSSVTSTTLAASHLIAREFPTMWEDNPPAVYGVYLALSNLVRGPA